MQTIRIGNDIEVLWKIFSRNGSRYMLDECQFVKLWLVSGPFKKEIKHFNIINRNEVFFTIESNSLRRLGVYKLVLSILDANAETEDATIDVTEVFQIVSKVYPDTNNNILDGNVILKPATVLNNIVSSVSEGTATAPDEEDITIEDHLLKFKDREATNGLGYKILRMGVSLADQLAEDTIFEIRYDFDLNSETVIVPSGCVLYFNGGCLKNGTLTLDNTAIMGLPGCLSNVELSGTCANTVFETDWLNIDKTGETVCTKSIQSAFDIGCPEVRFGSGIYAFNMVNVSHACIVRGSGRENTILCGQLRYPSLCAGDSLFKFVNAGSVQISDLQITCVDSREMERDDSIINFPLLWFDSLDKVFIDNVFYNQCHRRAFSDATISQATDWDYPDYVSLILCDDVRDVVITNSEIYDSYGGEKVYITHSEGVETNLRFTNNYMHDVENDTRTAGYSNVSAIDVNNIILENNRLKNWQYDQSAFNLFGRNVYISGNVCEACKNTLTMFDCCEFGAHKNDNVICTNNIVECKEAIMLLTCGTKDLIVSDNVHKGLALLSVMNVSEKDFNTRSIIVENNKLDCTYFTPEYQSAKLHPRFKSGINILCYNILNQNVTIRNNNIRFVEDSLNGERGTMSYNASFQKIFPIKVSQSYGTLEIRDNVIEGEFPLASGSSVLTSPIEVLTYPNTDDSLAMSGEKVGDIRLVGNSIREESAAPAGNFDIVSTNFLTAQIYNLSQDEFSVSGIDGYNFVDVGYVECMNRKVRGYDVRDSILLTRSAIKRLKTDSIFLRGKSSVYEVDGCYYMYDEYVTAPGPYLTEPHWAFIGKKNYARTAEHVYLSLANCCLPSKDSVANLGESIVGGNILSVGAKNYQCLKTITLDADIVTALSEDETDIGNIIQGDETIGSWRRCPDTRDAVIELGIKSSGLTVNRPTLNNTYHKNFEFFDETIGKPIWWTGTKWVDATGTEV